MSCFILITDLSCSLCMCLWITTGGGFYKFIKSFSSASSTASLRKLRLSISTHRSYVLTAVGGALRSTFCLGLAFIKVFLRSSSSLSRYMFFYARSYQPTDMGPKSLADNLYSYSPNCRMKVTLISRSGLREFKNSNVLIIDQLYFRMRKVANTQDDRLWPLTEWTSTL